MRQIERTVKPKVVLFDVGNTLLHVPEDPHLTSLRTVSCLDVLSLSDYKAGIEQAKREWYEAGGAPEREDLSETWVDRYKRALELAGFRGDVALTARRIEESFLVVGWEVYPEANDVLSELNRRSIRMGVVSNWTERLGVTLERAGLQKYFEVVVASGVVGYAKPHPEIYRFALKKLAVDPTETLFVGDSPELDIEGPAAVGIPSVLIDRERRFGNVGDRIESLNGLLDRLL
jgi:HAD superfamily hydrolase (TIGR01509 family)